ncbi:MAG: SurA N-terminal domain-containing protein, partial [Candidatus Symbiothrix sp.]|nr:SurA N-terminal domain-containing protein [Candidatus Symbiothrix sp.]
NQQKENIAVVEGQTIKIQEFQQKVEERLNMIKARNAGSSLDEDQTNQIRQSLLNEWINRILLEKESKKVGFAVGKDELTDLIMGKNVSPMIQQMPDFQNPETGRFDQNNLLRFLQSIEAEDYSNYPAEVIPQLMEAKRNWLEIEKQVAEQQLQSKISAFISATLVPNSLDAEAAYEENKVSVDFDYVSQTYASIPDDAVSVTDAEIAQLYKERKSGFKQEEAVVLDYITVNILPSDQDYQNVLAKMETIKTRLTETDNPGNVVTETSEMPYLNAYVSYGQLSAELKTFVDQASTGDIDGPILSNRIYYLHRLEGETLAPDSIDLNVIALPVMEEKELKHLSDSLIDVIKNGTSFADVVSSLTRQNSDGNLGWQTEATLAKQADAKFKDEAFAAKLDEPLVIQSAFGNFLVQVIDKTAPVKKYKIATVQIAVTPSQETKTKLYNDLNQYISANRTLETFKNSASEAGYNIQSNMEINKTQLNISGIQNTRQIIQWAFKNKKGTVSDIFECQNQEYFIVAAIENILKEGSRPLASVSDVLKRELINEKKAEKIIAGLKAKNPSDLAQYAEALNSTQQSVKFVTFATPRISNIGTEPVLNVEAPLAAAGQIAGPYKGNAGVYVISVTGRKESEQPYDAAAQKQTLQMQNSYRMYQLFQSNQILRDNAKIEDNFNRFF